MSNQSADSVQLSQVSQRASAATDQDLHVLQEQLGRIPRGVVGIAARSTTGEPLVVITSPKLEDGTPFPTTFYLTSPEITRACSVLEAEGYMEGLNARLQEDEEFAGQYRLAHQDYLTRRESLGEVPEIEGISAGGLPTRVKCLHAAVGHALAAGPGVNLVGDQTLREIVDRGLWTGEPA